MSRCQGELHVIKSDVDSRRIDECEVLRGAVDHLAQYLATLAGDSNRRFNPAWPTQYLAQTIADLCDMLIVRAKEHEREAKEPAAEE